MYNGEVNVAQNSLNDFLAAAEELAVKGEDILFAMLIMLVEVTHFESHPCKTS